MAQWYEGYADANGLRIHYWRTGTPALPALVLQHGFNSNGLCWRRVARALEGEWDVIMPDARGHGLTAAPLDGYSAADMAGDLAAFCAALGLQRPVLLGHSMGGRMVGALAAQYPDLPRAVILVDPSWMDGPRNTSRSQDARRYRQMPRDQLSAVADEIHADWDREDREAWVDSRLQMSEEAATKVQASAQRDWRADARGIRCPALLMTAEVVRGAIVTPQIAAEVQQLNPLIRVAQVADSGHDIYRDNLDGFLAVVKDFLASLDRPTGGQA